MKTLLAGRRSRSSAQVRESVYVEDFFGPAYGKLPGVHPRHRLGICLRRLKLLQLQALHFRGNTISQRSSGLPGDHKKMGVRIFSSEPVELKEGRELG